MTTPTPTAPDRLFPTPRPSVGRLVRLARKELTEILRDRRTIVTLIVMPLLLYPLLTLGFGQFAQETRTRTHPPLIRIGFANQAEQKEWHKLFGDQGQELTAIVTVQAVVSRTTPDFASGMTQVLAVRRLQRLVAMKRFQDALSVHGTANNLAYFGTDRPEEQVREGEFDPTPGVEDALRAGQLDLVIQRRSVSSWEIAYSDDSQASRDALALVQERVLSAEVKRLDVSLRDAKIDHARPLRVVPMAQSSKAGPFSLVVFVPVVLILMTITGAVYPAIDLTAGERERGTLEVLVARADPRRLQCAFAAKYLAVLTVAVLTAWWSTSRSMTVSLLVSDNASKVFGTGGLSAC